MIRDNERATLAHELGFQESETSSIREIDGKEYHFSLAESVAALEQTVPLQQEAFGLSEEETCPGHMLVTLKKIGGQVISVVDQNNQLASFTYIWPTTQPGTFLLDMVGVKTELRDKGIGFESMKFLYLQAERTGMREVIFTYDPLKVRNANIYLRKMGAQVKKYELDPYGNSELGGDRFLATWDLESERVEHSLRGIRPAHTVENLAELPTISLEHFPEAHEVLLPAPADETLLNPTELRQYQELYRKAGLAYFANYTAVEFLTEMIGGKRVNSYLLRRNDSQG